MGRLVQELNSVETTAAFSKIVDGCIRKACFEVLAQVCSTEIAEIREAVSRNPEAKLPPIPADILLLGGDDLLVLLPAGRALPFVEAASARFEELTRTQITNWRDPTTRAFFTDSKRLGSQGFTLSFGVAMARANYPFYLLLDLAEQLLKNAKRAGSEDPRRGAFWAPAYVDFHVVTSALSQDLDTIRSRDYLAETPHRRTLRPFAVGVLGDLRRALSRLRTCEPPMPRSKLHDLFESGLDPLAPASPADGSRVVRPMQAGPRAARVGGAGKPGDDRGIPLVWLTDRSDRIDRLSLQLAERIRNPLGRLGRSG